MRDPYHEPVNHKDRYTPISQSSNPLEQHPNDKVMDISKSHSLSTIVYPISAKNYKTGARNDKALYMRLESYYLLLINP